MTTRKPIFGYVLAISAAFIFGVNGVVIKLLMSGTTLSGFQVTFFRVLGAAVLMGAYLVIVSPRQLVITRKQVLPLMVMGVFGVASLQATYAVAVFELPVGIALLIEYTAVLFVALIARFFFKESIKARIWFAIASVLIGLAVVAQIWHSTLSVSGVLWGFGASASLTIYFVLGEHQTSALHPMAVGFWTMTAATVFWALFSGWWSIDLGSLASVIPITGGDAGPTAPAWTLLAFIIVLGTFVSFALNLLAISHLGATRAGIIATSEVLFAFLAAFALLGEMIGGIQLVGAGAVLIGVVLAQSAREGHAVEPSLALEATPITNERLNR